MKFRFIFLIIAIVFIQCQPPEKELTPNIITLNEYIELTDSLTDGEKWYFKDIVDDSIPGIGLEKATNKILNGRKGKATTVAVIDGRFDINHPALKNHLWKNPDEQINYLDDDGNGFVDDIYGWNFMGNLNGESAVAANQEYVRVVKLYRERFEGKDSTSVSRTDLDLYNNYLKAKKKLEEEIEEAKNRLPRLNKLDANYLNAKKSLQSWFPDHNYDIETLESIDTLVYPEMIPHVEEIREVIKWEETDELNTHYLSKHYTKINKVLNVEFNDREVVGDNPYDINDTIYGNNRVFADIDKFDHGTRVSGTITSVFDKAGADNLKIMALSKSPTGDYYDKDLALAIRYAVNKGARVINMSFIKSFSPFNQWVIGAMKYAEENNVLIVCAAGNSSTNKDEIIQYPSDMDKDGNELVDNLISVGASGPTADENLRAFFSSYGKENVDVFAPGLDITSSFPVHNNYGLPLYYDADGGTSLSAAITSGVAALLFSYYPELTAKEVKQILMESGIKYTFPVKISPDKENDSLVPFNKLSKSGKIINVYNALLMAEDFSNL